MEYANYSAVNFSAFLPKSKFSEKPGKVWELMPVILGGNHSPGKSLKTP